MVNDGIQLLGDLHRAGACFGRDEAGVTAIEYGLMAALIVIAIVAAVATTGVSLNQLYTRWTGTVAAVLAS
jgi:pilus assembly protein Flp/PilA